MRNQKAFASTVIGRAALGTVIVLCSTCASAQQSSASAPLADDLTGLRRQALALQREVSGRDKDLAKLQNSYEKARQQLVEVAEYARQLKTQLEDAREGEEAAISAARQNQKALEQAIQEAGKMREAQEGLEEAVHEQRALAEELGRENEVLKELLSHRNQAKAQAPGQVPGLLSQAHRVLAEGDVEEAAELFRKGAAQWPQEFAYAVGLASCHYETGNFPVAKAILEKVLDEDGDHAEAQGLFGLILWQENDLRQAERYLARAVREQPENERWLVYLGMVQYSRGREGPAQDAFEDAIRVNPRNPEAQFNLAVLLAGEDRPDLVKARVHYEQALRLGSSPDAELEKLIYDR